MMSRSGAGHWTAASASYDQRRSGSSPCAAPLASPSRVDPSVCEEALRCSLGTSLESAEHEPADTCFVERSRRQQLAIPDGRKSSRAAISITTVAAPAPLIGAGARSTCCTPEWCDEEASSLSAAHTALASVSPTSTHGMPLLSASSSVIDQRGERVRHGASCRFVLDEPGRADVLAGQRETDAGAGDDVGARVAKDFLEGLVGVGAAGRSGRAGRVDPGNGLAVGARVPRWSTRAGS
jgi:hypothetical protein